MRPLAVLGPAATLPRARRASPPASVPHPSWSAASERHNARRLSAEEFWARLGL